jgi:hypothetical protein
MADLAEYRQKAREQLGGVYGDEYERAYRQRAMQRYAEELPLAQALVEGMRTGETSQSLAAQRLGVGQAAAQQAGAAVAGPLAARQAMFGGAQQVGELTQRAAAGRAQEMQGAREAALAAQMRQLGYGQALEAEELRRRAMMQQAEQRLMGAGMEADAAERARNIAIMQGVLSAGAAVGGQAIGASQASQPSAPASPYGNLK